MLIARLEMLGHSHEDNPHGLSRTVVLPHSLVLNNRPGEDTVPGTPPAIEEGPDSGLDVLILKSASYILLSTTVVNNGYIHTYLGPNNHKIHTHLPPTQAPIKCLVSGHKPKMEWTSADLKLRKSNVTSAYITWWMKKNAKVRCDACGHVLRARKGDHPLDWLPQLLVPSKKHRGEPSTPANTPILSPTSTTLTA